MVYCGPAVCWEYERQQLFITKLKYYVGVLSRLDYLYK